MADLITGDGGGVTLPSTHYCEPFAWSISAKLRNKDVSRYGGGRFSKHYGGLIDTDATINAFLADNATAVAPGLTSMVRAGSTLTLTSKTGSTHSGTALFTEGSIQHAFADPAVPLNWSCKFSDTVSETWDQTP